MENWNLARTGYLDAKADRVLVIKQNNSLHIALCYNDLNPSPPRHSYYLANTTVYRPSSSSISSPILESVDKLGL